MKIPEFKIRTDLALEEREGLKEAAEEVSGVSFKKWEGKRSAAQITEVKVLNEHGAKALGKPMGSYLTLEADKLLMPDEDFHSEVSDELALLLKGLLKQKTGKNILVAGLGNQSVTPDSLGPRTVSNLCVSAEGLKAIAPGVMAQTGMETARILLGIIKEVQPDLVIAIDALAARSIRRLGTTIQLTDTGIHPGSGVGNHRRGMTRENLGVPVIAIGVPTVVGAAAIVHGTVNALVRILTASKEGSRYGEYIRELDSDSQYELIRELLEPEFGAMFVTPQDMDERICKLSAAIAEGIRRAVERLEEER